ncbi:hypothetical protein AB0M95_39265 [Sphaerisporangium sp. NPDC051017]|uniref:helix-turn-helix domain-containing protein n=1 Tax=Sphaerisporangium sp. NPDC051017 TaxID=3154636 RepID=UPI00342385B2
MQIAAVWESEHPGTSPRVSMRWAHNLTQQQVADLWNELDPGTATMTKSRIYQYERWPTATNGRRPSVKSLSMLARIYQTTARRLLTDEEYARYDASARAELDTIDHRDFDTKFRSHACRHLTASGAAIPDAGARNPSSSVVAPSSVTPIEGMPRSEESSGSDADSENEILAAAADESAGFARVVGQTNIGPTDLDQLEADVRHLARRYLTEPLVPLFRKMCRIRDLTFSLLNGRQYPEQTRRLYVIAGRLCGLLASVCSDLGYYDAADTHARTAWLCAELSGDDKLRAWILSTRSLIAFWDGRIQDAVQHAEHGISFSAHGIELVRLRSLEARARAKLGDEERTRSALRAAEETRQHVQDDHQYEGMFVFSPGNQERCAGSSYLWLGIPAASVTSLERALVYFQSEVPAMGNEPSYAHTIVTRLDLALAHLRNGDLDGALEVVRPVIGLPPDLRLAGVVRRTHVLGRLLATPALRSTPLAQQLAEQMEDFAVHNAARQLTADVRKSRERSP